MKQFNGENRETKQVGVQETQEAFHESLSLLMTVDKCVSLSSGDVDVEQVQRHIDALIELSESFYYRLMGGDNLLPETPHDVATCADRYTENMSADSSFMVDEFHKEFSGGHKSVMESWMYAIESVEEHDQLTSLRNPQTSPSDWK